MKKLKLSKQDKEKLLAEFSKKIDKYEDELKDTEISFEKNLSEKAKEKITIYFTPEAYIESQALVKNFDGEVGWHGLIEKIDDNAYIVTGIIVYPQVVNGARTLDPTKTNKWYEDHEDVLDLLHFQAHSHVNMSTSPSSTDMENQKNIVRNLQGEGFQLFQIWNKSGDINSFLYDLDNNVMYDRNDIQIEIVKEDNSTVSEFIQKAKEMVESMPVTVPKKTVTAVTPKYGSYAWTNNDTVENKLTNPFYWKDETSEGEWGYESRKII